MTYYTTMHDALNSYIEPALGDFKDDYDLDKIFDACFRYEPGHGFYMAVADGIFWAAVESSLRTRNYFDRSDYPADVVDSVEKDGTEYALVCHSDGGLCIATNVDISDDGLRLYYDETVCDGVGNRETLGRWHKLVG